MYPIDNWWDEALAGISDDDIREYANDYGLSLTPPSDAKVVADVTAAKTVADAQGNTKLSNTLDFILKYGDKALSILSKTGILKNQNLVTAGYSDATIQALMAATTTDKTSNAPTASNSVFNIDFTDPKTLIITFLIVMILAYFLFFYSPKRSK
jgi:hypothetical protein